MRSRSRHLLVTLTLTTVSAGNGGGLQLDEFSDATLTNNVVADNRAGTRGGGLYVRDASPRLIHTTVARNTGGDGTGFYVTDEYDDYGTVAMTNTIFFSHTVGITVTAGNTATLNATLWHANARNTGGAGIVLTGTVNVYDDPAFAPDRYHLAHSSAAIDAGVDAGVKTDIDGDIRPSGAGYDIGADELRLWYVYLPLVLNR